MDVLFLALYVAELLKWSDKIVPVKLPEFSILDGKEKPDSDVRAESASFLVTL